MLAIGRQHIRWWLFFTLFFLGPTQNLSQAMGTAFICNIMMFLQNQWNFIFTYKKNHHGHCPMHAKLSLSFWLISVTRVAALIPKASPSLPTATAAHFEMPVFAPIPVCPLRYMDTIVCSGTALDVLWVSCLRHCWTHPASWLHLSFCVIDPTYLTIVVAQAWCLTIFNLSPMQNTCLFTNGNKASVCGQ